MHFYNLVIRVATLKLVHSSFIFLLLESFVLAESFWGGCLPEGRPNLVRLIVSRTNQIKECFVGKVKIATFCYIVSFNFLCWVVQWVGLWVLFLTENPQFGQSDCFPNILLYCEFQLSVLSSSKVWFWVIELAVGGRMFFGMQDLDFAQI